MVWKREKDKWKTNYTGKYRPKNIHRPGIKRPRISKSFLIALSLVFVICVLAFQNFKTGDYVKVLEMNITSLKSHLNTSNDEMNQLTSNLNSCDNELEAKIKSIEVCNDENNRITSSLNSCGQELTLCYKDVDTKESNYNACQDQINDLENTIDRLRDQRDSCEDDLSSCQSSLSSCQSQ